MLPVVFSLCFFAQITPSDAVVKPGLHQPLRDVNGDLLPEGAVARMGSIRLRHCGKISGAALSPDGKTIFVSEYHSGVHVWDAANGSRIRRIAANETLCQGIALSPDGKTLAVNLSDHSVGLFEANTGRPIATLPKKTESYGLLVFSPDGTRLATGSNLSTIRIWDLATRQEVIAVDFGVKIGNVSFSADNKRLIGIAINGDPLEWDLENNTLVDPAGVLPEGTERLNAVLSRDGKYRAVWGYEDGSVRLFAGKDPKEMRRFTIEGGKPIGAQRPWGWLTGLKASISPDGSTLALFRNVNPVRFCEIEIWDVTDGRIRHRIPCGSSHKPSHLMFSNDGTKLVTAGGDLWSGDHAVRIWDIRSGRELVPFAGHGASVRSVVISPDGRSIATAARDGIVNLWDRKTGTLRKTFDGPSSRMTRVHFSDDGRRLFTWDDSGWDSTLKTRDTATGEVLKSFEAEGKETSWTAVNDLRKLAFSLDRNGRIARTHNLATNSVVHSDSTAHFYHNSPLLLSPGGDVMLNHGGEVVSVADRKLLMKIDNSCRDSDAQFSADGRRLVVSVLKPFPGGLDLRSDPPADELAVIDPFEGRILHRFGLQSPKTTRFDAVGISTDGRMFVSAEGSAGEPGEQLLILRETETGRERGRFRGPFGRVRTIAVAADGRSIVTAGDDTTALVWDAFHPIMTTTSRKSTDLADAFADLAGENAEQAYSSIVEFIARPGPAVKYLSTQESLFAKADQKKIQAWIRDLDSNTYTVRERATRELSLVLDEAEPELKKVANDVSAEARTRIDQLLKQRQVSATGRELQRLRTLEVLERIAAGEPESKAAALELLRMFATDPSATRVRRDAISTLDRLK